MLSEGIERLEKAGQVTSRPEKTVEMTSRLEKTGQVTSRPEEPGLLTTRPETTGQVNSKLEKTGLLTSRQEKTGQVVFRPEVNNQVTSKLEKTSQLTSRLVMTGKMTERLFEHAGKKTTLDESTGLLKSLPGIECSLSDFFLLLFRESLKFIMQKTWSWGEGVLLLEKKREVRGKSKKRVES